MVGSFSLGPTLGEWGLFYWYPGTAGASQVSRDIGFCRLIRTSVLPYKCGKTGCRICVAKSNVAWPLRSPGPPRLFCFRIWTKIPRTHVVRPGAWLLLFLFVAPLTSCQSFNADLLRQTVNANAASQILPLVGLAQEVQDIRILRTQFG